MELSVFKFRNMIAERHAYTRMQLGCVSLITIFISLVKRHLGIKYELYP